MYIMDFLQSYAPQKETKEETKVQCAGSSVWQDDMLLIIGDWNAKKGKCNIEWEEAMGRHGCETISDNKERPVDFCIYNRWKKR